MKNILIDTDILIDFLRGKEKTREFLLSVEEENTLYCSVITVAEIYAGMREVEKEKTDDLLDSLNIVEINRAIAEKAGTNKHQIRRQILELDDCMIAASAFYLKALIRNKTTFDTSKSTRKIVTNGVYRFSRNPLYFSLLLLLSGVAILLSSLWLFLAIPILYVLFLFKAVKPEEEYLLQKFGEDIYIILKK